MPVYDIYSRRKKQASRTEPEVYQYDQVPDALRQQICYILDGALGPYEADSRSNAERFITVFDEQHQPIPHWEPNNRDAWNLIINVIRREFGLLYYPGRVPNNWSARELCYNAIVTWKDIDDWLSVVEICFYNVLQFVDPEVRAQRGITQDPHDAIEELNFRFREAGLGYQFENGKIIRVDAQLLHSEVVKPALSLLADARLKGPQDEFLSAHAHYRAGEYEDAIVDAHRAFESMMKAICDIKGWQDQDGARTSDLVKIVRREGLLPDYLDASFDQLIATLKSGLPQVRNEAGGHGQGATPRETPGYIAGYALHLAAANIVLLGEALKATE